MKATLCDKCKAVFDVDNGDTPGALPQKTVIVDGIKFVILSHDQLNPDSDICKKCFDVTLPKSLSLLSGQIQPFNGKEHYATNEHLEPVCQHCHTATNRVYLNIPNLTCWRCSKPMEMPK